ALLQLPQDLDLRRLERDPARDHRQDVTRTLIMDFQYTQEQQQLADAVGRLVEKSYDFESRKKIVGSAEGWSPEVWGSLAEMGLLMIPFTEADGGFGGGATDLIATMEAIGAGLVVEPFLSTVVSLRLIANAGSAA